MGKIIWLASYPKSGNTWVRAFLANLFTGSDKPYDINALNQFCPSLTGRALYGGVDNQAARAMAPVDLLRLRQLVQQRLCENIAESAFIKTHSRFGSHERFELPLIMPEYTAGAIYIVRNPLDVAVSASSHFGVSVEDMVKHMADPDFGTGANDRHVPEYIGSWSGHVKSWTIPAHPKVHIMRYEDIHAAPETAYRQLLTFLGLKPEPGQLEKAVRNSMFNQLSDQEKRAGFNERSEHAKSFFRRGKPGEGKEKLKPALVDAIVKTHREQMERFGYLP